MIHRSCHSHWYRKYLAAPTLCGLLCSLLVLAHGKPVSANTGTFAGQVFTGTGSDRQAAGAGVVVYFESAPALDDSPAQLRERAKNVQRVIQKNERFSTRLTVIPRGGTVAFPNQDRVFHNVFSLSKAKRFDLGLFRDGDSRSVTFKRAGVVDVYCNIHPKMATRVVVVPNRFYALTDDQGRFTIASIPAGTYTAVVWNGGESRSEVVIRRGKTVNAALTLPSAPRRKRHQRKDGTPYRRYR